MAAVQHLAARWQQLLPMSKAFLRLRSASPSRYKDFTGSCTAVRKTPAPRFPAGGQQPVLSVLLFCCTYRYVQTSTSISASFPGIFPAPGDLLLAATAAILLQSAATAANVRIAVQARDLTSADPIRSGLVEVDHEAFLLESGGRPPQGLSRGPIPQLLI